MLRINYHCYYYYYYYYYYHKYYYDDNDGQRRRLQQNDTLRFCWKIFDYHIILTNQFDRNDGSSDRAWLAPRARLTVVSVRLWDAKKLRRFCKQDKAWCDVVGNKLSIKKYIPKYWTTKLKIIGNEVREYSLLLWSESIWKPEDYYSQNTSRFRTARCKRLK